ncbi:hypothetical protein KY334_06865 [Candidatus Woesearchaeota archaeon]|nr:hypothetical protein [Candidatus Woesearchaeota archaeon]
MAKNILKKEYSIGEILSDSWKRFIDNFGLIFLVTLIVYIPINFILNSIPLEETVESIINFAKYSIILEGLFGIFATMAIAFIIKSSIDGKKISLGSAFSKSLGKWWKVILTNLVLGLFLFGLMFLLVIPAIIFYIYWIFAIYVVLFTDNYAKGALDYSKKIVEGRWWKVLGYSITFAIIASLVYFTLASIPFFESNEFWVNFSFDIIVDVLASFFIVVSAVFFINFDATKKSIKKISKKKA